MIILAIIAFVFGLGLIICIHELGHFIFAKKAGVLCYEFSFGMGPALYRKKKGETTFAIRAIPIGGYVAMAGEEIDNQLVKEGAICGINLEDDKVKEFVLDETEEAQYRGEVVAIDLQDVLGNGLFVQLKIDENEVLYQVHKDAYYLMPAKGNDKNKEWRTMQIAPYERSFDSKPLLPRFLSIAFGPIMNFILGIFLCFIVGLSVGKADLTKTVINEVSGPAATIINETTKETILMKNDEITSIEGVDVTNWNELSNRLDEIIGSDLINMTINRDGVSKNISINPIIYIGNLGVCGYTSKPTDNGIQVMLYITNSKKAGLMDNDFIKSVDGTKVNNWPELVEVCRGLNGEKVEVIFDRPLFDKDGNIQKNTNGEIMFEEVDKKITIETFSDDACKKLNIEKLSQAVGISPSYKFDLLYAMGYGFTGAWQTVVDVFNTLSLLFGSSQVGVSDLSGPVGIFSMIESSINQGFITYISFLAMLSVNIGIMNLLPLPALDGGRLVFLAYEAITHRKPNKKVENIIHTVFLMLLMLLFVYITFNDIGRLFG